MQLKKLGNAYVIVGRFVLRAKVILSDKELIIKPLPNIGYVTSLVKGALSKKEVELLVKSSTKISSEIVIGRDEILGMEYVALRKNREDIARLFNVEEIKGNIYRVTLKCRKNVCIRLILPQNEFIKLKNYVSKGQ